MFKSWEFLSCRPGGSWSLVLSEPLLSWGSQDSRLSAGAKSTAGPGELSSPLGCTWLALTALRSPFALQQAPAWNQGAARWAFTGCPAHSLQRLCRAPSIKALPAGSSAQQLRSISLLSGAETLILCHVSKTSSKWINILGKLKSRKQYRVVFSNMVLSSSLSV